ncbi:MAG: helix-turn-helix domain-containing protein [Syntrophobacteraceae bacterium]
MAKPKIRPLPDGVIVYNWIHSERYARLPVRILAHKHLSPSAIKVACALLKFDWKIKGERKGYVYYGIDSLKARLGMSAETIIRALKQLQKYGFLRVIKKRNETNIYAMMWPQVSPQILARDYRVLGLDLDIKDLMPMQEEQPEILHFLFHLKSCKDDMPKDRDNYEFEKIEEAALSEYEECGKPGHKRCSHFAAKIARWEARRRIPK